MRNLLEFLRDKTNCEYISDLKSSDSIKRFSPILSDVDDAYFSLEQWNDAISYISRQKHCFASTQAAKEWLLAYCEEYLKP